MKRSFWAFESLLAWSRSRELLRNKHGPFLRKRKDISESGIKRPEGKAKDWSDDRLKWRSANYSAQNQSSLFWDSPQAKRPGSSSFCFLRAGCHDYPGVEEDLAYDSPRDREIQPAARHSSNPSEGTRQMNEMPFHPATPVEQPHPTLQRRD